MNDPRQIKELSADYKTWLGREGDCGFFPALKEVERLCEVIVGIRARIAELEGARAKVQMPYRADLIGIVCKALNGAPVKVLRDYTAFLVEKMNKDGDIVNVKAFQRVLDNAGNEEKIIALAAAQPSGEGEGR